MPKALLLENIHPDAAKSLRDHGFEVETMKGALSENELIDVLEEHMKKIGLLKNELDAQQQAYLDQKRAEYVQTTQPQKTTDPECDDSNSAYPDGAQLCAKCHTKAMIQMDGCLTCLSCGESKCG